jgi:Protein of unknown function (DUF4239)
VIRSSLRRLVMIDTLLYTIPSWLLFILIVGGPVGLAWIGTLLLRRHKKAPMDDKHNEVAGYFFDRIGVVYAVLLAFVVIVVWEQYLAAESAVSKEAAALITVARDTSSFPEPARSEVYDQLHAYAESVINNEWKTIDEGTLEREESRRSLAAINNVWIIYRSLPPSKVDPHTTESLDDLSTQRAVRLQSTEASVPTILWFGLVIGAVVTICFCLVLYMENVKLHAVMTALLTGLIATCLWMTVVINHPFAGDLHVPTDGFRHAIFVIDSLPR